MARDTYDRTLLSASPGAMLAARRLMLFLAMLLSGGNLIFPRIPLLAGLILVALAVVNPGKLLRPELSRIWLVLLAVLTVSLVGSDGLYLTSTAVRYANFLAGLLLLIVYLDLPRDSLIQDALPLLMIFAIQAIATPVLAWGAPYLFSAFRVDETIYHTIFYLFTYHETIVTGIKRPDGFFFEPGVLQIYLNLYLFAALFLLKRPAHVALALVGVLSTQSTTGIVVAVMICAAAAWSYLRQAGVTGRIGLIILAPVLLAPLLLFAEANLQQKLLGALSGSTEARRYDFSVGLRIIAEYPLTGIGFEPERYVDVSRRLGTFRTELAEEAFEGRMSSNGIVNLAYRLGIPMFLVLMWGLFRQRVLPHRVVVFALFFVSFLTEALLLTPFFLLFMLSGFVVPARRRASRRAAARRPRPGLQRV